MKRINVVVVLFLMLGWSGCRENSGTVDIVTVDISQNYPKKELVLQDFMDVEYIPLETNDEFITQGDVMAIDNKYIVVKNWNNDGDIFLFDRKTGKGVRKWNRRGQGAEEYTFINGIVLDEGKNELYVNSTPSKKILVYDLFGNFKRSLNYVQGAEFMYNPQIQISAESETKRSIFREKDKTKRSKKESAQHSKSRNKSFVMTSVSAL